MNIFRQIWERWKVIAQIIGDFIGRIILSGFYFTILVPFGLGVKYLSDPLAIKDGHRVEWEERKTHDLSTDDVMRLS